MGEPNQLNQMLDKEIEEGMKALRTINSKEEAEALLAEMMAKIKADESLTPKERNLKALKVYKQLMDQVDKIWQSISRNRKRKIMNPRMKYSNQVRARLKGK